MPAPPLASQRLLPAEPASLRVQRRRLASALLAVMAPMAAQAATLVVTSPDDTDAASPATCTLRQAILSFNIGSLVGACQNSGGPFGIDDSLTFAASAISGAATPGTVTLADSADSTGGLGGTLVISAARLTIDGSEWRGTGSGQYADGVTIARPEGAAHAFGVLRGTAPAGGLLELKGLALRNGDALPPLCGGRREGGGVCMEAADLAMVDSRVSGNRAGYGGGGIASLGGALVLTRCTIDNNAAYLGGGVHAGSAATVSASRITENGEWAVSHGGGIHAAGTLAVVDSTISGNTGKRGAGLQVGASASLLRSIVSSNQAYYSGGGLHVLDGAGMVLDQSTISANSARYVGGGAHAEGTLNAINTTIAGNQAAQGGGGVYLAPAATLQLDHATLASNGTGGAGGGIGGTGTGAIDRSIIAGNSAASGADIDAGVAWSGSANLVGGEPVDLGPLQDNGGPTPTMLPGAASAAIDAIATAACMQAADQRGVARPHGAGCDIGAVEVVPDRIFADGFEAGPPPG